MGTQYIDIVTHLETSYNECLSFEQTIIVIKQTFLFMGFLLIGRSVNFDRIGQVSFAKLLCARVPTMTRYHTTDTSLEINVGLKWDWTLALIPLGYKYF